MDRKLVVILVLLLISGIALSLAAWAFGVFPFDLKVAFALRGEDNPAFAALMTAVSFLGDGWMPVLLVFAVAAVCAYKKRWLEAAFVVATLSSGILAGVLKMLVGRSRPPSFSMNPSDIFQSFNQYAYPSGHVLFFVVFFGFVAYLCLEVSRRLDAMDCHIPLCHPDRAHRSLPYLPWGALGERCGRELISSVRSGLSS